MWLWMGTQNKIAAMYGIFSTRTKVDFALSKVTNTTTHSDSFAVPQAVSKYPICTALALRNGGGCDRRALNRGRRMMGMFLLSVGAPLSFDCAFPLGDIQIWRPRGGWVKKITEICGQLKYILWKGREVTNKQIILHTSNMDGPSPHFPSPSSFLYFH